jgi:hypothetical protein
MSSKNSDDDPNRPAGAGAAHPRRYESVTWADARRVAEPLSPADSIIQRKAIDFAEAHALPFELGRWNGVRPTVIGPGPTRFSERSNPSDRPVRLDVAVLGAGVVGGGVVDLLRDLDDQFRLVGSGVSPVSSPVSILPVNSSEEKTSQATPIEMHRSP